MAMAVIGRTEVTIGLRVRKSLRSSLEIDGKAICCVPTHANKH
jgi:hypothetical protein